MQHYDAIIIGAGMSGLGAGIRLAQFDRRVLIVERHNVYGGLNSFYTLAGRRFDVGLHALTNFARPAVRGAPLTKLLRQLRIPWEAFDLREQSHSRVCFPGCSLRFSNDPQTLLDAIAAEFPGEVDGFQRHLEAVRGWDDLDPQARPESARRRLSGFFRDPLLIDMLLCPVMYYGSPQAHDMDWNLYVTLFKSIFLQGLARPRQGVRRIIAELVKRYRGCGGEFRLGCGVRRLESGGGRVRAVHLDNGEALSAAAVLSSIGHHETLRLCDTAAAADAAGDPGRLSFMETIYILDQPPRALGLDATIMFYNDSESFTYACPDAAVDSTSGVICAPNNYDGHDDMPEGVLRITSLANHAAWTGLSPEVYQQRKADCAAEVAARAMRYIPDFRQHVVYCDTFTPRTIEHYTGHIHGAVYGAPRKIRDGRTHLCNLFLCGTDQGYLGIIGALMSGISMANQHVLAAE